VKTRPDRRAPPVVDAPQTDAAAPQRRTRVRVDDLHVDPRLGVQRGHLDLQVCGRGERWNLRSSYVATPDLQVVAASRYGIGDLESTVGVRDRMRSALERWVVPSRVVVLVRGLQVDNHARDGAAFLVHDPTADRRRGHDLHGDRCAPCGIGRDGQRIECAESHVGQPLRHPACVEHPDRRLTDTKPLEAEPPCRVRGGLAFALRSKAACAEGPHPREDPHAADDAALGRSDAPLDHAHARGLRRGRLRRGERPRVESRPRRQRRVLFAGTPFERADRASQRPRKFVNHEGAGLVEPRREGASAPGIGRLQVHVHPAAGRSSVGLDDADVERAVTPRQVEPHRAERARILDGDLAKDCVTLRQGRCEHVETHGQPVDDEPAPRIGLHGGVGRVVGRAHGRHPAGGESFGNPSRGHAGPRGAGVRGRVADDATGLARREGWARRRPSRRGGEPALRRPDLHGRRRRRVVSAAPGREPDSARDRRHEDPRGGPHGSPRECSRGRRDDRETRDPRERGRPGAARLGPLVEASAEPLDRAPGARPDRLDGDAEPRRDLAGRQVLEEPQEQHLARRVLEGQELPHEDTSHLLAREDLVGRGRRVARGRRVLGASAGRVPPAHVDRTASRDRSEPGPQRADRAGSGPQRLDEALLHDVFDPVVDAEDGPRRGSHEPLVREGFGQGR
jgi:hypothetical protein